MDRPSRRPSSKDVAALAGVSLGSVSRVINRIDNVTPAVRAKVEQAMAALDYRPDHAARTLRSRTSHTVGCLFPDVSNPLYASLFRLFEGRFGAAGYVVLLADSLSEPDREVSILETFRGRGLDGALIAPSNERDPKVVAAVERLGLPAVVVDRDISTHHDQVRFDHVRGVREAVSHLIGLGHRRIAILVSAIASRPMRRRVQGFRTAHAAHGLVPVESLIVKLPASTSRAFETVSELLMHAERRPTALLSLGTNVLGDVLNAIAAQGLRVPHDISVVSMGEPEFARRHVPAIGSVMVDLGLAADESMRLLLERMHEGYAGPARRILVPTRFEPRASCAAPPALKPKARRR